MGMGVFFLLSVTRSHVTITRHQSVKTLSKKCSCLHQLCCLKVVMIKTPKLHVFDIDQIDETIFLAYKLMKMTEQLQLR